MPSFADRRVEAAARAVFLLQALGAAEHAAEIADVLAEHDDVVVARHRDVHRVADRLDHGLARHRSVSSVHVLPREAGEVPARRRCVAAEGSALASCRRAAEPRRDAASARFVRRRPCPSGRDGRAATPSSHPRLLALAAQVRRHLLVDALEHVARRGVRAGVQGAVASRPPSGRRSPSPGSPPRPACGAPRTRRPGGSGAASAAAPDRPAARRRTRSSADRRDGSSEVECAPTR